MVQELNGLLGWSETTILSEVEKRKISKTIAEGLTSRLQRIRAMFTEVCIENSRLTGALETSETARTSDVMRIFNTATEKVTVIKAENMLLTRRNEELAAELETMRQAPRAFADVVKEPVPAPVTARKARSTERPKAKANRENSKIARTKNRNIPTGPRFELVCEPGKVEEVRKEVWQSVISKTKVPRVNVIKGRSNLIIIPDDNDTLEVLRKTDKVRELGPRLPMVIIYNVQSDLTEAELMDGLRFQNPELKITEGDISATTALHKTGPKDKDVVHWVLETLTNVFDKVENKKIFLGMSRCNVKLYKTLTQCYNCQRFGHTALKCKDEKPTCKNCAGDHDSRACDSDKIKCANCKGTHRASNSSCKVRDRVTNALLRRTDFGTQC